LHYLSDSVCKFTFDYDWQYRQHSQMYWSLSHL
jgi:hypothetical protein